MIPGSGKMLSWLRRDQRGLTLVEMVVVVAIISIIVAMVMPRLTGQTTSARSNGMFNDLREVEAGAHRYEAENRLFPKLNNREPDKRARAGNDNIVTIRIDSDAHSDPTGSPANPVDVTCTGATATAAVDNCFARLDFDILSPEFVTPRPEHASESIDATIAVTGSGIGNSDIDVDYSIANCNRQGSTCDFILDAGLDLDLDGELYVWVVDKDLTVFVFKEGDRYGL